MRPIVFITSNNEKELPDAFFLRRCFFSVASTSRIARACRTIVDVHYPGLKPRQLREALNIFYDIRDVPGHEEAVLSVGAAQLDQAVALGRYGPEGARGRNPRTFIPQLPRYPLIKNEQDVQYFERLAFLNRRKERE